MKSLLPISWLYALFMVCRNKAFDWGFLKSYDAGVPVISVGNLTVGGTGKTPLVEFIVRHCIRRNKRATIISRGYGRSSRGVVIVSDGRSVLANAWNGGDEPVQMALKFPSARVVVAERRVDAARTAVERLDSEVLVLDDGFQHRYLKRDLDIVVIDSRYNPAHEMTLPAGMRRESMSGLQRAGVVALSRVENESAIVDAMPILRRWYTGPVVAYRYGTTSICRFSDRASFSVEEFKGKSALAFSGIGDHEGFLQEVQRRGVIIKADRRFSDHHAYTIADIKGLCILMMEVEADCCLTTQKDAIRLLEHAGEAMRLFESHPLYYTLITVEMVYGKAEFLQMIDDCIDGRLT